MLPQAAWFTTITPFATTILHFLPLICLFYNKIAKSTSGKNRVVRQKIRKKFCISLSYFGEPYHIYAFVLLLFLYMVFHLQKTNQKIFHPSENRRNLIPENPPPPAPLGMNPPEGFYDIGDEDSHTTKKRNHPLGSPFDPNITFCE